MSSDLLPARPARRTFCVDDRKPPMANEIRNRALVALFFAVAIAFAASKAKAGDAPPPVAPPGTVSPADVVAPSHRAYVIRGAYAPPRQPDGNSVLFGAPDGWVLVDSGRHPEHLRQLLALAEGLPIRTVVNTHWHLDHVGGNPALRAAFPGLEVIASPAIDGALDGFLADYADQLRGMLEQDADRTQADDWRAELARIENGAALRPDRVVTAPTRLVLAGREFQLGFEADAVTAGDVWVFDPVGGLLAAGDLVTLPAPFFDTACPARWQAALHRLGDVPFTMLVPGHGPQLTRARFDLYRRAFDGLLACAASDAGSGECIEGWLADAAPLLPDETARAQARSLLEYYLPSVLRGPAAGKYCPSG